MAEKIIIFEADIDTSKIDAKMILLTQKQEELKRKILDAATANKTLKKEAEQATQAAVDGSKENVIAAQKAVAALVANENQLTKLRATNSEYTREVKQLGTTGEGSLKAMSAELAKLNTQYTNLSKTDREGALGAGLQKNIAALGKEVFTLEQGIGRSQRNVGNYGNAWQQVAGALGLSGSAAGIVGNALSSLESVAPGVINTVAGLSKGITAGNLAAQQSIVATNAVAVEGIVATEVVAAEGVIAVNEAAAASSASLLLNPYVAAGVAAVAFFGAALKLSNDYNNALIESQKITGETTATLDEAARRNAEIFLKNGQTVVSSLTDIATIQQQILSFDPKLIKDKAGLDALTQTAVLTLKVDTSLDPKAAIDGLTSIIKAQGLTAADSVVLGDRLANTQKQGDLAFGQIVKGLIDTGAAAKLSGININDNLTLLNATSKAVGGVDKASTQLVGVFSKLSDKAAVSPEGIALLQKSGANMDILFSKTAPTIDKLKELALVNETGGAALKVFGEAQLPVVKILADLGTAAKNGSTDFVDFSNGLNATGALGDAAGIQLQKSEEIIEAFTNRLKNLFTSKEFSDGANAILAVLAQVGSGLIDFGSGLKDAFGEAFTSLGEALRPIFEVLKSVVSAFMELYGIQGNGGEILKELGYLLGKVVLEPIEAIAAGIKALNYIFKVLYDAITFGAGVIKDNVTVWREYSSTFDTVINLLEQAFGAVKNLTFGFLGMSSAIDSTKKTGLSLTDSLGGGLKAMSASLTATAAAVGATDTALKNVKNLTLPELTAKLNEAKNAYALLGVEGQKTAKGLALAAERDAIQKQIDSINGKKEAAPKAAKKVEEPLIVGGIREAEKVLKALEDKLQNTKLDTPVAAAIAAKVVEAKKELERLKKVYDEFFADPTKKAAEAAKDNRDTRATANDRRAVADNVEPSVAKQIQLENERRYQFELTTIYVAGSKERKEAEKELAKVDLEIIKAANEDKKQIEKETEKERVEAEKQRLEAIKELRLKYDAERANDIELINNDEKANEADKKVFLLEAEQKYWTSILSIQGVALKDRIADQNKSNETELKLAAAKVVRRREIEKQIVGAAKDVGKTILQLDADFTEAEKNNRLNALDDERNKKLAAAGNDTEKRAQIEKEYDAKKAAIEKEAAQRNQKNALATAILNGALAVTSILAQYPKFDGGILMAIALAAAVAATAGQIAVISSQKFGRGGKLEGRSHSDGGETATVGRNRIQLEGGEGILNTRTMSSGGFAAVASYLNEAGGGVSFSNTKLPELLKSQILDFANGRFVLPNVPSLVVARQTPIVVQQAYYQNINTKNLEQIGAKTNALLERISKNAGINRETQKTYF